MSRISVMENNFSFLIYQQQSDVNSHWPTFFQKAYIDVLW